MGGGRELCWEEALVSTEVEPWRGLVLTACLPGMKSLIFLISWSSQVQSMKQTNSSLRQALEGGIDPLRPPEVRLLFGLGFSLQAEQKGAFCLESRASIFMFLSIRGIYIFCFLGQYQVQLPLDHR